MPLAKQTRRRPTRIRVKAHRDRLRAQGLRPVQIWIPDLRNAAVREEIARQCRAIANDPNEPADQAFIDAISFIKL